MSRQSPSIVKISRSLAVPLSVGIAYFLLAAATIHLTDSSQGIAAVWPANAVLMALMVLRPKSQWPAILAAGFIANALANLLTRDVFAAPLLFGLANVVEVMIASVAFGAVAGEQRIGARPASVFHLILGTGIIAPGVSALLGASAAWLLFDQPFLVAFARWFAADALGLLIFSPFFCALLRGDYITLFRNKNRLESWKLAGLFLLTALVATHVFALARYPMLFITFVPVLLVTFRAGWHGMNISLMIIAVIGAIATMSGLGPLPRVTSDPDLQIYFFQIYIAGMLLIQLPIAAALAAKQELIDKLKESEQSLRLLAAQSPILLLSFDLQGACQRIIGTTEILLDRDPTQLVGRTFDGISEEGQYELKRAHNAALEDISCSHSAEFRAFKVNDRWLEAVFRSNFEDNGRCIGTIASIHDVTQRKNQELSLSRTATTDSLTGLLNRAGFRNRLDHALIGATAGAVSVAMIDVDRFKLINDNSGHQIGDLVLKEIARRIANQVRASDAVCRLGGDEFIILLATPNWTMAQDICHRIVSAVSAEPISLPSGNVLRAAVSCGVARLQSGATADEFIHDADVALYEAKRAGRNRVVAA